ncbi:MAG TPA: tRNA (adenosine(37)-N6)-threonylcarbamoyltransferase complex ATPase subunit type 1 TsaE [Candidatus Azoamicus sp.]
MFSLSFYFNDYISFNRFSVILSRCYLFNTVIFLVGDFGVGKTFFSKGFLGDILNYNCNINSSSFSKVNVFFLNDVCYYHSDFYDFISFKEANIKLFRYLYSENFLLLVEWGEKLLSEIIPDICINIFFYSFSSRCILIKSKRIDILKLFL